MKFQSEDFKFEGTMSEFKELMRLVGMKEAPRGTTVEEVIINSMEAETIDTNMIGHFPSIEITGRHYDAHVFFKNDSVVRVEVFIPAHVNVKPKDYIKELFV
jgi:hypothetical protein